MKTITKINIARSISFFLKIFIRKKSIYKRNGINWFLDLNEGIDLSIYFHFHEYSPIKSKTSGMNIGFFSFTFS